jgi:SAM-dependent methyltransferase
MNIAKRSGDIITSFIKKYGPSKVKKVLWDQEFSSTKWDFMDDTSSDCIYPHLEKYARNGDILDLGCGPGNTANELAVTAYRSYVGLDISEAAVAKGVKRTKENGREHKNTFAQGDFLGYTPTKKFDVILFRESVYHIPFGQVKPILDKYSKYLSEGGVFIVRLYAANIQTGEIKSRVTSKLDLIRSEFDVVEESQYDTPGRPTVLVFRPRRAS